MTRTLVTGATGLVGYSIAKALRDAGRDVRLLVRNPGAARTVVPEGCEIVQGDVTEIAEVERAMNGCGIVYHAAGIPEQWLPDPLQFAQVNVGGTQNMIVAARTLGVEKFVFTSTQDVFRKVKGREFDESVLATGPMPSAYQQSKLDADLLVAGATKNGLPAVHLHPVAVYGPGPSQSRGMNQFFLDLIAGAVPVLLAGGVPMVYAPDVGKGHLLAESAPPGSRYMLCEKYYTLKEIAEAVHRIVPAAKVPSVMPVPVAKVIAAVGEFVSGITGKPPLIPRGQLSNLLEGAFPSHAKATTELHWHPTALADALPDTLAYLQAT